MPPGLRLPRLYAALERPDDRIDLWLEDVDPTEEPWTTGDLARAATGLGRLTVRRADEEMDTGGLTFLDHYVTNALLPWAIPALRGEELWEHPAFAQPEVAALRGDATTLVLIDWGSASPGPIGWDLVPLVFGPAENGTAPPEDLPDRLAAAVPGFEAGLAEEGLPQPAGEVARVVRTCALLRYPFTSLPLNEAMNGSPVAEDLSGYARRKAAFVRRVLDACSAPDAG